MGEERQGRWNTVKIYLDSYIVTVFWLHLLCLYLVGTIGKKRVRKKELKRVVGAAFLCALTDAGTILWLYGGELQGKGILVLIGIAELFIGCRIAFGKQGLLLNTVLLFGITALFAGIFHVIPVRNVGVFCMLAAVLLPFIHTVIAAVFRNGQIQTGLYDAKLYFNGTYQNLPAFMDTGNRLRLYGSKMPVVLVDESCLSEWMKEAEIQSPQKLVFLPYKGVGGRGLLHGIRLQCDLYPENGQCIRGEVAAVAAEHRLFSGCRYRMILQPEVLSMVCVQNVQEGEKNVI